MTTNTNTRIIIVLLATDIALLLLSLIFFSREVLFSMQIGFISSSFVMGASIISYKRMVDARVKHNIITLDDSKDVIDNLEDPYDLYSEDIVDRAEDDLVEVVKMEQKKLKDHRSLYQILKDTKAALSIYRLSAYGALILGFLYLNRQGLFDILSYIIALGLPSVIIVTILLNKKEEVV